MKVRTRQHDFRELLLIDSPGLATVTEQNAQLTRNVLEDVDIALWVLNANHLGQTDIMQEVENLAQLGKPIIAVISKIDEVDTSPERLIKYVNRHAGEYFTEVLHYLRILANKMMSTLNILRNLKSISKNK